jgi:hypothetical protein
MYAESEVSELLAKQAIYDVVVRYCRAVDRLDMDLLRTCYHQDAQFYTGRSGSIDEFVTWIMDNLPRFKGTMHIVGNHLCQVSGDEATAETYGTSHHWGEPFADLTLNFATGFRYVDHFARRNGEWRILKRTLVLDWSVTVPGDSRRDMDGKGVLGARGDTDPSHGLFGPS